VEREKPSFRQKAEKITAATTITDLGSSESVREAMVAMSRLPVML
jgi:hypothetical protein